MERYQWVTIILALLLLISAIVFRIVFDYQSYVELQTILKNQCGAEYSLGEVWRNGENLARICGLN